ncbi:MAG TPA: metal-dependent hydrolase [Thermoflexales bacterium]|nr:metal-dependent hydrolase [Thermoflexales bacterium]
MKGIAHFATGLCVASFVPGALEPGSLLIALGGACAMLPDFLDFRFERFLEKHNAEIAPDMFDDDPQRMAEALAAPLRQTLADGKPRRVQLHPSRKSALDWTLYTVRFDAAHGEVSIRMDNGQTGRARVGKLAYGYDGDLHIEELGGPSFEFTKTGDCAQVEFLPWHRARTHSLVVAALVGLLCFVAMGPAAGAVGFLAYAAHVLEDQLGYMGNNMFWPLTRERSPGLRLLHASDAPANLTAIWLSLTLLLLNMDHAAQTPLIAVGPYLAFAVLAPALALATLQARKLRGRAAATRPSERDREIIGEMIEAE